MVSYQLASEGQTVMINVDGLSVPTERSIRYQGETPVTIEALFVSGKTMKFSDVRDALIF